MKKTMLSIFLILISVCIYSQSLEAEKEFINMRLASGKLSWDQAPQLMKKWSAFIGKYGYPGIKTDTNTQGIDSVEILTFTNSDKKLLYQRSMQWMAINFFELSYNDLETGKIIANGSVTFSHTEEYLAGFGAKGVRQTQTPANYTLILTIKDNKIKYKIQDISYSFTNFSETISEITLPLNSLFPIVSYDQFQWLKIVTLLNETDNKFRNVLKDSLVDYVKDADTDYDF